jgi:pimeloyl-ACP methyl ester carboxylesterase
MITRLEQPDTRTVRLPNGRILGYSESGAPDGAPVFLFHGLPGSRLQRHPDDSIARRAGARFVHVERPGFGLSSPQPRRRLSDWPRDVAAVADALGITRFAVAGISGGGPSAAACVAALSPRITRAAIVSSVGPPGSMTGRMTFAARLGFFVAPRAAWALRIPVGTGAYVGMRFPELVIDLVAGRMVPADRAILGRSEMRAMFAQDMAEAFRQGSGCFVQELALIASPWKLDWRDAACAVELWHGEDDWLIPPSASRHLANAIPGARLRLFPREGHFMVFDRWRELCEWLTS